jgi:Major Facilitator Superfamily
MTENTAGGVAVAEKPYERRWAALAVLALSLVVIGMDNTILNVALPTLVRDLGASASELQWMVDAYILVFAGLLLTMEALGDRFGRKLVLDLGLLVFVAGSVASARHSAEPDRRAAVDGRAGQPRLRDHRGAGQRLDRPGDAVGILGPAGIG